MKLASFIATTLLAASAFAYSYSYHDYDAALRGIALDNACITDTEVRTIQPMRVCTELVPVEIPGGNGEGGPAQYDWVCKNWQTTHVAHSRTFERPVCVEWHSGHGEGSEVGCKRVENKADFLPATIKVAVVTENGEYSDFPGKVHMHTFPACK